MSLMSLEELKNSLKEEKKKEEVKEVKESKRTTVKKKENKKQDIEKIEVKEEDVVLSEEEVENKKVYLNLDIVNEMQSRVNVSKNIISNIISMLDEGDTIPFIARYRKEKTNSMSDEELRLFEDELKSLKNLITRKEEVLRSIDNQEALTDELIENVRNANTLKEVEDIYRPFKQKKKTRATEAKRKGLEPLAIEIKSGKSLVEINSIASGFLNEEVETIEDAINGAMDIIAEEISDNFEVRQRIYENYMRNSEIVSAKVKVKEGEEDPDSKELYKVYYDYSEKIFKIPSHRYLAINRGENEGILKLSFNIDEEKILENILKQVEYLIRKEINNKNKIDGKKEFTNINLDKEIYTKIVADSFKRLIKPSIEREIRQELKEKSDLEAINIFGKNLKQLLLVPPVKNMNILGYDPGFRNGSKLATIDKTGKFISEDIIHVTMPNDNVTAGLERLKKLISKDNIDIIAIGNGTASRESEKLVANLIKGTNTKYIIVSEAGASVYSASKLATEEFPDVNVSIRGAISIARRLQDPLSELVKIEPKSIGVGQYQHDVNQKELEERLKNVVVDTVNSVGVDINTATFSLISYVSGLSKRQAKAIVKHREEKGIFKNREEIKKVSGIGEVAYKQAVGFLRIYNGENPLDVTGIHPESYDVAKTILESNNFKLEDINNSNLKNEIKEKLSKIDIETLKNSNNELKEIANIVIDDIIKELINPGIDIRDELPKPILRQDVLTYDDLQIGMELSGTVRNVAAFGAFVDIGLHDDGLVHISELSDDFVKDPQTVVKTGDIVKVRIIKKDDKTHKVSLSMKGIK